MDTEQIVRCAGEGCEQVFQEFRNMQGTNPKGAFNIYLTHIAEVVPAVNLTSFWMLPEFSVGGIVVLAVCLLAVLLIALAAIASTFFTVQQQTAAIVERFGRFQRIAGAGLHTKIPFVDQVADEVNLRVQQLALEVETKTLDDVFVEIKVAIQYAVLPDHIMEASYALDDEEDQITSYVFDIVRGRVPKLKLDDVFAQKDEISDGIQADLNEKMAVYGYKIHHAPITDIIPDALVRDAMNQINMNARLRIAATEKGEAEKTLTVKQAEAKKESDILRGQGIAGQRKAMIEGLRESVQAFKEAVTGVSDTQVMNTVMMSQYFDMLKDLPKDGNTRILLLPHSPNAVDDISRQVRESLLVTQPEGGHTHE